MKLNFYILLLCCICFHSCNDDIGGVIVENADIELRIASKYNGETFFVSQSGQSEHIYSFGGKALKFTDFKFFLSNFTLLIQFSEDNIALDEIEFINPALFEGQTAADKGVTVNIGRAPTNTTFEKLFCGLGVSQELNSSKPNEYGGNHPLSNEGLYLEEVESYISLKIEGEVDQDNDGNFDDVFSFDLIFDDAYQYISKDISPFEVFTDQENLILMEFDVQTLLQNIDFNTQLNTSNTEFDVIMTTLKENFANALVIK